MRVQRILSALSLSLLASCGVELAVESAADSDQAVNEDRDRDRCDDDCGGHGTTYLYQNFPGPGTMATNADMTPMHDWWVYLFY